MQHHRWLRPLLCCLLLLLAACGERTKLPRLPAQATILAFGDSLTYGTGATPDSSYPSILSQLIGHPVANAGIPGNTTEDGLGRLDDVLAEQHPALLILCLGGNDFLQQKPETETVANLRSMLNQAQNRRIPVLLVATPKPGLTLAIPDFYRQLAEEYRIPLEDQALRQILGKAKLKSDAVHPNAEGYRELAEAIASKLHKTGAV
ncbi:arylesterase [Chitinimonas sp.]|uniref:arylesterase n=1 Tax=Chitinimonas sp. TaxID=1934313 RepID=UPI002F93170D